LESHFYVNCIVSISFFLIPVGRIIPEYCIAGIIPAAASQGRSIPTRIWSYAEIKTEDIS
jgi:hypothetical protein